MPRIVLTALAVLAGASSTATLAPQRADDPNPATVAALRGVVMDFRETPLRRAQVVVSSGGRRSEPIFTGDRGEFEVTVPTGTAHRLTVSKPGYAAIVIARSAEAAPDAVRVRLGPGAVIVGHVSDPAGDPVASVPIRLQQLGDIPSPPPLSAAAPAIVLYAAVEASAETDDQGEFRIGSLPPGEYRVVADAPPLAPPRDRAGRLMAPALLPGRSTPVLGAAVTQLRITVEPGAVAAAVIAYDADHQALGPIPPASRRAAASPWSNRAPPRAQHRRRRSYTGGCRARGAGLWPGRWCASCPSGRRHRVLHRPTTRDVTRLMTSCPATTGSS